MKVRKEEVEVRKTTMADAILATYLRILDAYSVVYLHVCNIRRICCPFSTGIELDYIVLRRIYLSIGKLIASSLRAPS